MVCLYWKTSSYENNKETSGLITQQCFISRGSFNAKTETTLLSNNGILYINVKRNRDKTTLDISSLLNGQYMIPLLLVPRKLFFFQDNVWKYEQILYILSLPQDYARIKGEILLLTNLPIKLSSSWSKVEMKATSLGHCNRKMLSGNMCAMRSYNQLRFCQNMHCVKLWYKLYFLCLCIWHCNTSTK